MKNAVSVLITIFMLFMTPGCNSSNIPSLDESGSSANDQQTSNTDSSISDENTN